MFQRSVVQRRTKRALEKRDVEERRLPEDDRHFAERCRLRDVVVRVPTLRSLPYRRFHLVVSETSNLGRGGSAIGGARLVVGSMTGGKRKGY